MSATTSPQNQRDHQQRWARVAGLMYLAVLILDIAGTLFHSSLGRSLTLAGALGVVPLALRLYYALRPVHPGLAAAALGFRLVEATLGAASTLADYASLHAVLARTAFGTAFLHLAAWNDATVFAAFVFSIGSTIFFCLFLKSASIPRALAWLGLIASMLAFVACAVHLVHPAFPAMTMYLWTPMLLGEVSTGLWLLLKPLRLPE